MARQVVAIVVTYHPDVEVLGNLTALKTQVNRVVVVDNGSSEMELEALRGAGVGSRLTLIENGSNLGIATALNVGVRAARSMGAEWVVLFDQDSCVTEGLIDTMMRAFEASEWGARLGVLVPRYVDRRLGTVLGANRVKEGLEAAMTSGSLLRMRTFEEHGFFVDALFIDGVDYEYSLRLRAAGLVIEECADAVLMHSPGEPRVHRLGGRRMFQTANYSPLRRYYQERNKIWVAKRYFWRFPIFCLKLFLFSCKDFVKIVLAESNKREKCRYFLRGMLDGLRERMGKLEPTDQK